MFDDSNGYYDIYKRCLYSWGRCQHSVATCQQGTGKTFNGKNPEIIHREEDLFGTPSELMVKKPQ